jgi:Domain of unknown function (DUF4258)
VKDRTLVFSSYAVRRMFSRRITESEVETAIDLGTIIESYPDDTPFASYLVLDFIDGCPIHVVYSIDESTNIIYVITAYNPDPAIWENNFSVRK